MQQQRVSTNENNAPKIIFDARNHLKIEGSDNNEIEVAGGDRGDFRIEPREGGFYIFANEDAAIRIPRNSAVKIERANANVTVRGVSGDFDIDRVNGNLTLSEVGSIDARRVDGNFVAVKAQHIRCMGVGGNGNLRDIIGNVQISVGGNLSAQHVEGELTGNAGGNVDLTDIHSNVSANAGGNSSLRTVDSTPQVGSIRLNSGNQTTVRLGQGANATINARDSRGRRRMVLGDGSTDVQLSAGGNVNVEVKGVETQWTRNEGEGNRDDRRSVPLGEGKHIHIEAGESIKLTGYDGSEVIVDRAGFGTEIHEDDGNVHIEAAGPVKVSVPNGSIVRAEAGMEATIRDFTGELSVEAGISVKVRNYVGRLTAEAGSDANVVFTPTGESRIEAGASVRCRLTEPGNATVHIEDMRGDRQRIFGDGSAPIYLSAGASVAVGTSEGDEGDGEGFNFQFNFDTGDLDMRMREFGDRISGMAREFSQRFEESGVPTWLADEMSGMQERIDEAMRRAQDKINRKVDSAVRRAEKRGNRRGPDFSGNPAWQGATHAGHPEPPMPPDAPEPPAAPVPPRAPSAGPSSEERMMILRMLEQKKITADEAAKLLGALGDIA